MGQPFTARKEPLHRIYSLPEFYSPPDPPAGSSHFPYRPQTFFPTSDRIDLLISLHVLFRQLHTDNEKPMTND